MTFSTLLLVYSEMFDIKIAIFFSNDSILNGYRDLKIKSIPMKQISKCFKNVRVVTSINLTPFKMNTNREVGGGSMILTSLIYITA